MTFLWVVLMPCDAAVGLVMFRCLDGHCFWRPASSPGWVVWAPTVCYHRALAHRALRLHPVVQEILIFFAMYNGSGRSTLVGREIIGCITPWPIPLKISPVHGSEGSGGRTCGGCGKLS